LLEFVSESSIDALLAQNSGIKKASIWQDHTPSLCHYAHG